MNNFENSTALAHRSATSFRDRLAIGLTAAVRCAALVLAAAVPVVVAPQWGDAYNYPKVLVVYALAATIVVGWGATYLLTRRPPWRVTGPEISVWLFLFVALVSSWFSVSARLTLLGAPGRYEGLLALAAYVVFFFVGVHFFGSEHGFRKLATVAGVAAVLTMLYGVSRLFLPPLFPNEVVLKQLYDTMGYPRVYSTVGNPVTFGGYLAFMIPLAGGLAFAARDRDRVLWLVAAALGYAILLMTFTRAAWLAVGIGTGMFLVAVGPRALRRYVTMRTALAVLVAMGLGVTIAVAVVTPAQLAGRVSSALAGSGSVGQRVYIWSRTIDAIRSRPVLGWGLETLRDVFPYEREGLVKHFGYRPIIIDEAHNDVLQMAVSIGVPGALIYVVFWFCILSTAARILRRASGASRMLAAGWLAAVVAYLVQAQFSFSTVAIAPVVWLLAGSASGWEAGGES